MITLKDYAKQHNVTYEAIRSQVNRYREQLGDHIIQDGRQQFLDDYAVAFLDERRQKNPVVMYQQNKDELIEQLENENKILLAKLAAANEKNVELMQYKLTSEEQRRALEDAQTAQARRERELDEREGYIEQQIVDAVQKAAAEVRSTVEEEKDKEIDEIRKQAEFELKQAEDKAGDLESKLSTAEGKLSEVEEMLEERDRKLQELENRSRWQRFLDVFK